MRIELNKYFPPEAPKPRDSVDVDMMDRPKVVEEVKKPKSAAPTLIYLLKNITDDEISCKVSVILSDMACLHENQIVIAEADGIKPLVDLLQSKVRGSDFTFDFYRKC